VTRLVTVILRESTMCLTSIVLILTSWNKPLKRIEISELKRSTGTGSIYSGYWFNKILRIKCKKEVQEMQNANAKSEAINLKRECVV